MLFDPGIVAGMATEWPEQKIEEGCLSPDDGWRGREQPFSRIDAISAREMVRTAERNR